MDQMKWIDAAFFDLEAEIIRQGSAIGHLLEQCEGRDSVEVAALRDSLSRLRRGNSAMRDIISNVHHIHEDEKRAGVLEEKPHNLKVFLEQFCQSASDKAKAWNVGFRTQLTNLQDSVVRFDQVKLNRLLINLLNYLIPVTGVGGRITFQVVPVKTERAGYGAFLFEMTCTGTCMTEGEIKNAFDPARKGERGLGGSAFSLSVVRQLVEMMCGQTSAKAEPGVGNIFCVRLEMPLMSSEEENRFIADKRILLVDDNLLNSELVADLLREAGAVVEIVSCGEEAVDMVSNYYEGYYDIVLTDIEMSGIDGYETARQIREIPWANKKALKIIALSAFEYEEEKEESEGSVFNAYCMKPFDIRKFAAAAFDSEE